MNRSSRRGLQRRNQGLVLKTSFFLSFWTASTWNCGSTWMKTHKRTPAKLLSCAPFASTAMERTGIPEGTVWASLYRHTSILRRDVSIVADAKFHLANGTLSLGLDARLKHIRPTKEPKSTRLWFLPKFQFTQVFELWPRICACQKCDLNARTHIRHGESQLCAPGCDLLASSSYTRMIPYFYLKNQFSFRIKSPFWFRIESWS